MGNACLVGHITVKDEALWADYRRQVPATLEPWGGELLLRGKRVAILAGEHTFTDIVVIRFPGQDALAGWHASDAYQALIPLRQRAAEVVLLAYEE